MTTATMFNFFGKQVQVRPEDRADIEKSKRAADKTCRHCGRVGLDYLDGVAVCPRCKRSEVVR
jgi:uncharacterized OB-fold protein